MSDRDPDELELVAAFLESDALIEQVAASRRRIDAAIEQLRRSGYTDARIGALVGRTKSTITKRRTR